MVHGTRFMFRKREPLKKKIFAKHAVNQQHISKVGTATKRKDTPKVQPKNLAIRFLVRRLVTDSITVSITHLKQTADQESMPVPAGPSNKKELRAAVSGAAFANVLMVKMMPYTNGQHQTPITKAMLNSLISDVTANTKNVIFYQIIT